MLREKLLSSLSLAFLIGLIVCLTPVGAPLACPACGMGGFPEPEMIFTPGSCLVAEELSITEDLFFSRSVTYKISNICDQPVTRPISFKGERFAYAGVDQDNRDKDLSSLKVTVNGQAVTLSREAKAWSDGKDVTAALENAGLSPNIIAVVTDVYQDGNGWRWLVAREHDLSEEKLPGLVDKEGRPLWEAENTCSFTQTFPPGGMTVISYSHDNLYEYWQTGLTPADSAEPTEIAVNELFLQAYGPRTYDQSMQYVSKTSFAAAIPWEHPIKSVTIVMNEFKPSKKKPATGEPDFRVRPSDLGEFHQILEIKAGKESRQSSSSITLKLSDYSPNEAFKFSYTTRQLAE